MKIKRALTRSALTVLPMLLLFGYYARPCFADSDWFSGMESSGVERLASEPVASETSSSPTAGQNDKTTSTNSATSSAIAQQMMRDEIRSQMIVQEKTGSRNDLLVYAARESVTVQSILKEDRIDPPSGGDNDVPQR